MRRLKIFTIVAFAALTITAMGAGEPTELVTLRGKFNNAMDRATEGLTVFWDSYKRHLGDLRTHAKEEGNLEAVLEIETEITVAESRTMRRDAKYGPLKVLQESSELLRAELSRQISPERTRLYGLYGGALQNLEISLTKEGRLDEAILVRKASEEAKMEASATQKAPSEKKVGAAPAAARLDWTGTEVVGNNSGGAKYQDLGEEGAVLIGFDMVITAFKNSNDTVRGIAPIFLGKNGETKGGTHGTEHGISTRRVAARPGYAVGRVTLFYDTTAIRRIKVRFDRINGKQLNPSDSYEEPWVGIYREGAEGKIDLNGKLPVGIAGRSGEGLNCLGLLYLNP